MSGSFTYHTAPRGITFVVLLLLLSPALPYAAAQSGTDSSQEETYRLNANFNPSMAIIIVVLVCAFFFMGFFSIYVRRCADGSVRNSVGGDGRLRRGGARGLDLDVIGAFPIFVYSAVKDLKIGKGALECAVCLSEFEDDETLRLIPKCDHVFHPECIDTWLASHTTCPVCRANLSSDPGELASGTAQQPDSNTESDEHNPRSELTEVQNQVSIYVGEDQSRDSQVLEMVNTSRTTPKQNRLPRSRGKFPRSHSTGHSLVQRGENCERYTLRLPEEVRKQMVMSEKQKLKLKRTTSCVIVLPREGSSRKGYWSGGEGSSRGKNYPDRWVFSMAPPFFTRTVSVRSPKVGGADGDATASTHPKTFLTSVIGPLDCLAVRADGAQQSSTRTPV